MSLKFSDSLYDLLVKAHQEHSVNLDLVIKITRVEGKDVTLQIIFQKDDEVIFLFPEITVPEYHNCTLKGFKVNFEKNIRVN